MSTQTKRVATVKNPTIEAVAGKLFRFNDEQQAIERIQAIRDYFILSAKLPQDDNPARVKLWVKGFKVTPEEEKKGYRGNYVLIRTEKIKGGKFTLVAEKLDVALKYHPQKERPKMKHPDWGHPVLRHIQKKPVYPRVEDAMKLLQQLHEEYPTISIPTANKLYIIIYEKAKMPPVQKWILEIKVNVAEEGGFFIEARENTYQKKELPHVKNAETESGGVAPEQKQPAGYFSSMVALKQAGKKKPAAQKPKPLPKKDPEETAASDKPSENGDADTTAPESDSQ